MRVRLVGLVLSLLLVGCPPAADDDDVDVPELPNDDDATEPPCPAYDSTEEEYAPIQTAAAGLPGDAGSYTWQHPAASWQWIGPFAGTPGSPASHEGTDYVHDDASVGTVTIGAAAEGTVACVRTGCPQSTTFGFNTSLRECGSGWGNHVVVAHGVAGTVTRYAHLEPGSVGVAVGEVLGPGDILGSMGNSGRSDVRHLHFELGTVAAPLDPCQPAQSFDAVYDSAGLSWSP